MLSGAHVGIDKRPYVRRVTILVDLIIVSLTINVFHDDYTYDIHMINDF